MRLPSAATAAGDAATAPVLAPPRPKRLESASAAQGRSTIRFREADPIEGIDFVHVSGNSPEKYYPTGNGSGVAMLDFDGDGHLDLYFATTRNLPLDAPTTSRGNKLYRSRGDGTFEDVTERRGVGFRGFCHGVAVGDVDNNGFPDLYLTQLRAERALSQQR